MLKSPIITPAEVGAIFSIIEIILNYNSVFLNELEHRLSYLDRHTALGDIFLHLTDFFKIYTEYINNYNNAITTLEKCKKEKPLFAEFLKKLAHHPDCKRLDLTALLIMPIQRIPRYPLLLQDLLRYMPEDHKDYKNLNSALDKMSQIAQHVNERKREYENLKKIVDIQSCFIGIDNLVAPHRRFIREGELKVKGDKKIFFLFNDILLHCKKQLKFSINVQYKVIEVFSLAEIDLTDVSENAFLIVTEPATGSLLVEGYTPSAKDLWIRDLKAAINRLLEEHVRKKELVYMERKTDYRNSVEQLRPFWVPDDQVTECSKCRSPFTVTNRRHHCRACGQVFCNDCSKEKLMLVELGYKESVRVCDKCYLIRLSQTPNIQDK